jgi:hypothetical protein
MATRSHTSPKRLPIGVAVKTGHDDNSPGVGVEMGMISDFLYADKPAARIDVSALSAETKAYLCHSLMCTGSEWVANGSRKKKKKKKQQKTTAGEQASNGAADCAASLCLSNKIKYS